MKLVIDYRLAASSTRGMARYCREITRELLQSLSPNDEILLYVDKGMKQQFLPQNVSFRMIPTNNFIIGEQLFIPYYLEKDNADVLWSPSNTFPLWKKQDKRYFATIHDLIFMSNALEKMSIKQKIGRVYRKFIVTKGKNLLDGCFTVSNFSKNQIENLLKINKVVVTNNCIGRFIDKVKELRKNNFYIQNDYFFTVSGDTPSKNFNMLFEFFKTHPQYKLVVAGFTNDSFYRKLSPSNIIILPSGISDEMLIKYYIECKCFVFISKQEGFGIPILEALACGCKIIASNTTSIPEIAGNNARYINPTKMEELELAISECDTLEINQESIDNTLKRYYSWKMSAKTIMDYITKTTSDSNINQVFTYNTSIS